MLMVLEDFFRVENCEISLPALNGMRGYHTLIVTGYCQKRGLDILIDLDL